MIHCMTHLLSPVLRARKCQYGYLVYNIKNYAVRIKSGFSEVLKTLLYLSQKIQLILMILMVS